MSGPLIDAGILNILKTMSARTTFGEHEERLAKKENACWKPWECLGKIVRISQIRHSPMSPNWIVVRPVRSPLKVVISSLNQIITNSNKFSANILQCLLKHQAALSKYVVLIIRTKKEHSNIAVNLRTHRNIKTLNIFYSPPQLKDVRIRGLPYLDLLRLTTKWQERPWLHIHVNLDTLCMDLLPEGVLMVCGQECSQYVSVSNTIIPRLLKRSNICIILKWMILCNTDSKKYCIQLNNKSPRLLDKTKIL